MGTRGHEGSNVVSRAAHHPAKFNAAIIERIADYLEDYWQVLDPFAGVGGIAKVLSYKPHLAITGIELEPEWAEQAPSEMLMIVGDCVKVMANQLEGFVKFDAIATSPAYGNRMADSHTPGPADKSRRNTYTHSLGRKLDEKNTAQMQWGDAYKKFHRKAWYIATMLVRPGGLFVLNCKDHIRDHQVQAVTAWHTQTLHQFGWDLIAHEKIESPGLRDGANSDVRVPYEWIKVFMKPNDTEE